MDKNIMVATENLGYTTRPAVKNIVGETLIEEIINATFVYYMPQCKLGKEQSLTFEYVKTTFGTYVNEFLNNNTEVSND